MKTLRWIIFAILYLAVLAYAASAQTISPVVVEGGGSKAQGSFTVTNNGLLPAAVTVEAHTLDLRTNTALPLAPTTHVELSQTSARLGAKQNFTFNYIIKCDAMPCVVQFQAGMMTAMHAGPGVGQGLAVRIVLPHVVYLCQEKGKGCRDRVRKAAGI
jgi:hypothetical protein